MAFKNNEEDAPGRCNMRLTMKPSIQDNKNGLLFPLRLVLLGFLPEVADSHIEKLESHGNI